MEEITKIKEAMTKKAVGYDALEVVEEYQKEDEGMTLTKKRVTKKHYPPDTQAAKMILDSMEKSEYSSYSDEELKTEIKKLIEKYKGEENE